MEIAILAAAVTVLLAMALFVLRLKHRGAPNEEEILREFGFVHMDAPPPALLEAMGHLHQPDASEKKIKIKRLLRKHTRAADIYFIDFELLQDEARSYRQALRSLHAYNAQWRLPATTILTMKESDTWLESGIAKALEAVLVKHAGKLDLPGMGEFSKRAMVFAESEADARHLLDYRVRRALLSLPYNLMESRGPMFVVGRPAQAGRGNGTQADWRQLLDAARTLSEELSLFR
ncbi:MAG: hypothetical protein U5J83_08285 [Bryobacterales bacterium]|nr:hypothetical protein [Bryobacterales bacterium]